MPTFSPAAWRRAVVAALARYDAVRRTVHRAVVRRMAALPRLARGRPAWLGVVRHVAIPLLTGAGPARTRMRDFMTGLAPASTLR